MTPLVAVPNIISDPVTKGVEFTLTEQFNFLRTIISPFFEFKIKKEREERR